MSELPNAPLQRIFKKAGEAKISGDAKTTYAEAVEEYALELAKKSIAEANSNKRKTVKPEDIKSVI
ncbi:histone family protein [Methanobrevibacter curvatus]|uniref:Histone-like transcription factor (CBF/NF-Y) and archaeal histone n=1 Tax=Methanobrevibacter curvatus TaxID=49547 RepID=A0A166BCA0_9EURY|nr:histone [Methanobrevibacter curvatus]KZX13141.1 histone-like transcription factor (CBF/NF-Y) and archaeal histone [Methanobrevibacter curvatus]